MGMGTGIVSVVAGPYGMEVCATRIRGIVLAAAIFWGAIATLAAALMMNFLTLAHPLNWHLPVYATWGPIAFMLFCFALIPESPWFHARRGHKEKAFKSLKKLYGNIPDYDYEEEYGIIVKTIANERAMLKRNKASAWTDLFKAPNGRRTLSAVIIASSLTLGGFPLLYTFSTYTYALAGFKNPFQTNVVTACVQVGAVLFMILVFDKYGRRVFVTWAYSFQAIAMLLWGCIGLVSVRNPARFGALVSLSPHPSSVSSRSPC